MDIAKQFSVALANKPGRLAAVLTALTKEKVGIRAFSVMDSHARGLLRFVPEDPEQARAALEKISVAHEETEVLMVGVCKDTGGLPKVCQRLAEEHLNIDYAYGSVKLSVGAKDSRLAVVKINDLAKAQRVLGMANANQGSRTKSQPGRRPSYAR